MYTIRILLYSVAALTFLAASSLDANAQQRGSKSRSGQIVPGEKPEFSGHRDRNQKRRLKRRSRNQSSSGVQQQPTKRQKQRARPSDNKGSIIPPRQNQRSRDGQQNQIVPGEKPRFSDKRSQNQKKRIKRRPGSQPPPSRWQQPSKRQRQGAAPLNNRGPRLHSRQGQFGKRPPSKRWLERRLPPPRRRHSRVAQGWRFGNVWRCGPFCQTSIVFGAIFAWPVHTLLDYNSDRHPFGFILEDSKIFVTEVVDFRWGYSEFTVIGNLRIRFQNGWRDCRRFERRDVFNRGGVQRFQGIACRNPWDPIWWIHRSRRIS